MQTLETLQPVAKTSPAPASTPPQTLPLEEVIEAVRVDSRRSPQNYLDESLVPGGGE